MRLRRSDCAGPGLRRVRRGRGLDYLDEHGERVADPEALGRIRDLVIPPAWQDVWICPHPNGHIQAVGTDAAGRKQYLYHRQWRAARDEDKHQRVLALARRLPEVRARIHADLVRPGLGRERVLAGPLRILDRGVFRVGGEDYAEENNSRGVATLLRRHVTLRAGVLRFRFPAKSGVERVAALRDPELARLVAALRRGRADGDRLFAYRSADGVREVRAAEVNERFKEFAGAGFTVKDMRTWAATVLAATEFGALDPPTSPTAAKRAESRVMQAVAEQLGNTATMARKSYVDPRVCDAFRDGRTIADALRRIGREDLDSPRVREPLERAILRLLRAS